MHCQFLGGGKLDLPRHLNHSMKAKYNTIVVSRLFAMKLAEAWLMKICD